MTKQKGNNFCVKLSSCGHNRLNGTYPKFESKSALVLSVLVIDKITEDFVSKKHMHKLQYDLAVQLLKGLKGFSNEDLLKDLEAKQQFTEDQIKKWLIMENEE